MKRILTIAVLLLAMTMPGHAVLQERDLKTTIAVLRNELETNYHESQDRVARYDQMNESQHKQIVATMQKSDEISLMLYSQQPNYTFDLAYACDEATQQYRDSVSVPFRCRCLSRGRYRALSACWLRPIHVQSRCRAGGRRQRNTCRRRWRHSTWRC